MLWVEPETMLIERLQGEQTLPDGARYRVTLAITPQEPSGDLQDEHG